MIEKRALVLVGDETIWHKSSYSGANGACVEVATTVPDRVATRDSKDPSGPVLHFPRTSWSSFVEAVKTGDLPIV